jgi:ferredoxin
MPRILEISEIRDAMIGRARELLKNGGVSRVLGWERGEFYHDPAPAFFDSESELERFVYNGFSSVLLSKYLIGVMKEDKMQEDKIKEDKAKAAVSGAAGSGKTLVFLKPCDAYGLNLLVKEHKIEREKVYAVGIGCPGMLDIEKIKATGVKIVKSLEEKADEVVVVTPSENRTLARRDVLLGKCLSCKGWDFVVQDEVIAGVSEPPFEREDRFAQVAEIEALSPEERFAFWRNELSRCIRCNACRNACPVCSCNRCVFDNPRSGVQSKSKADSFEDNMFHIIRAFHVAGRCSDCGECSRVCPQRIPLHLLNRKFIKDINEFYGEFQAGADIGVRSPLTDYKLWDAEPGVAKRPQGGRV